MEAHPHAKLVRGVGGLIEADLLMCSDPVDRERRGFVADWRGADVPPEIVRFQRPAPGHLIFPACAKRPSTGLRERDIAEAIDGERGRRPRRRNETATQFGIACLLPTVKHAVDFEVEAERAMRSPGACR